MVKIFHDKKGWIRIVEAFIAILLIMSVIFVVLANRVGNRYDEDEAIYQLQETVLDEIANNDTLRIELLDNELANVNNFIRERIPASFSFETKICEVDSVCPLDSYRANVYANEVIISEFVIQFALPSGLCWKLLYFRRSILTFRRNMPL